jgi:Mn-dependent DtxR family transcriptional regulator
VVQAVVAVALGALTLVGCTGNPNETDRAQRDARVVRDVIARVGDRAIGAAEIQIRMAADGIGAAEALEQLIEEELLVQEAVRRGLRMDREDERAIDRLMVRSMLRDFEKEITPESISEEEVRESYARIEPNKQRSLPDLESEIRDRLSEKKRFERLVETIRKLEAKGLVHYDDQAVERLTSMQGLPERGD